MERKPQRAKRNIVIRACCRRPAWTNRHGQEACLCHLQRQDHHARDFHRSFRVPQSVQNRHQLRWTTSCHHLLLLRASMQVGRGSASSCVRGRQASEQHSWPLLCFNVARGRPSIGSCTFKMEHMALEALRRSSSQEKAPRARKVMKSLHGDQLECCLVSSGDLHKPASCS